jgi:hypothetical protein
MRAGDLQLGGNSARSDRCPELTAQIYEIFRAKSIYFGDSYVELIKEAPIHLGGYELDLLLATARVRTFLIEGLLSQTKTPAIDTWQGFAFPGFTALGKRENIRLEV